MPAVHTGKLLNVYFGSSFILYEEGTISFLRGWGVLFLMTSIGNRVCDAGGCFLWALLHWSFLPATAPLGPLSWGQNPETPLRGRRRCLCDRPLGLGHTAYPTPVSQTAISVTGQPTARVPFPASYP